MSKTYEKLLTESPEYAICAYGSASALGMSGSAESINKAWNLFCNFDREVTLHRITDSLSYISTSKERLKAALSLYLYVNILHSKEVPSVEHWDEETGVYLSTHDDNLVKDMVCDDIKHFFENLKVKSFIPSSYSSEIRQHSLSS